MFASELCERNYKLISGGCYYDPGTTLTKDQALPVCQQSNGHIITIESQKEYDDVESALGIPGNVQMNRFVCSVVIFTDIWYGK